MYLQWNSRQLTSERKFGQERNSNLSKIDRLLDLLVIFGELASSIQFHWTASDIQYLKTQNTRLNSRLLVTMKCSQTLLQNIKYISTYTWWVITRATYFKVSGRPVDKQLLLNRFNCRNTTHKQRLPTFYRIYGAMVKSN